MPPFTTHSHATTPPYHYAISVSNSLRLTPYIVVTVDGTRSCHSSAVYGPVKHCDRSKTKEDGNGTAGGGTFLLSVWEHAPPKKRAILHLEIPYDCSNYGQCNSANAATAVNGVGRHGRKDVIFINFYKFMHQHGYISEYSLIMYCVLRKSGGTVSTV